MPQQPNYIDNYDHFSGADWNDVINTIFGNNDSECYKLVQPYLDAQEAYLEKIDDIQDDIAAKEDDLNRLEEEIKRWEEPFVGVVDISNIKHSFTSNQNSQFNNFIIDLLNTCLFKFIMTMLTDSNMRHTASREGTDFARVNVVIDLNNDPHANPTTTFNGGTGPLRTETNPVTGEETAIMDITISIPMYRHPSDSTKDNYHYNFSSFAEELFHAAQIAAFEEYRTSNYDDLTMEVEAKVAKIYAFYKSHINSNDTPQNIDNKMDAAGFLPYEKDFLLDYNNNVPTGVDSSVKNVFDTQNISDTNFQTDVSDFAKEVYNKYQNQPGWNITMRNNFSGIDGKLLESLFKLEQKKGGC